MLTIALDATQAADPSPTGIGIYCQRLIAALADLPPFHDHASHRLRLCFRPGPYWRWARKQRWPGGATISPLLEFWPRPGRAQLFHGLNQRLTAAPYPARVATIHDLFPLTSREYSKAGFQSHFSRVLEQTIARANRIIAVSEATRLQLLQHTDADPAKIRVVHHGVDRPLASSDSEQKRFREFILNLRPGEKYFLNVGTIQVRKNVENIVLALGQLPGYRLVLAGGEGYGAERILARIKKEGMGSRVIRIGHASADMLPLLYSTASALVFPSLEEGFGFPILEAMSYGLPVITSNGSSMPEVAGDAALLVDPLNVAEIGQAMRRVAEDPQLSAGLARRGLERYKLFTWKKCAQETWKVYQETLQEKI